MVTFLVLVVTISFTALRARVGDLALKVTNAGLAGISPHKLVQRIISDRPFVHFQAVRIALFGYQMAFGDFDLFILGVAGDADDLHAVQQRLRACSRLFAVVTNITSERS